ncbi:MAG: type II secretion system F family protein [Lachnospiraceae bacterium]|nr:type II secretion system F family protein [Lachnospiraceae bacterium]
MASFGYSAVDIKGNEFKGSLQAQDLDHAMRELKGKGLLPVRVVEQNVMTQDINFSALKRVTARDLALFCRQFTSIYRAGVPIVDCLRLLTEQTANIKLKDATQDVLTEIEKGEPLSQALMQHPKVFPALLVTTVAAGEATGTLDVSFERMALQFEKTHKLQAMVKKAMIYPLIVAIVAIIVVIVMLVKVIPSYVDMFAQLGTQLPAVTRFVVALSEFVVNFWFVIAFAILVVVLFVRRAKHTKGGRKFFDRIALKLPLFGKLNEKKACSMLARTLATLYSSGVPMADSIEITARTMENVWYHDALTDALEAVIAGQPLSRPLEVSGLFPPLLYHMIRIGEETGETDVMLEKLADYYDEEVENATQSLSAAMEPMIIIVLALIVGFLVAAIMAPMLTMYQALETI